MDLGETHTRIQEQQPAQYSSNIDKKEEKKNEK
jgi:hypothetical protein